MISEEVFKVMDPIVLKKPNNWTGGSYAEGFADCFELFKEVITDEYSDDVSWCEVVDSLKDK